MSVSKCLFKYNHTKLDILSHFFKEVVYPIGWHENQLGTSWGEQWLRCCLSSFRPYNIGRSQRLKVGRCVAGLRCRWWHDWISCRHWIGCTTSFWQTKPLCGLVLPILAWLFDRYAWIFRFVPKDSPIQPCSIYKVMRLQKRSVGNLALCLSPTIRLSHCPLGRISNASQPTPVWCI